jgi:hypothetical protein
MYIHMKETFDNDITYMICAADMQGFQLDALTQRVLGVGDTLKCVANRLSGTLPGRVELKL